MALVKGRTPRVNDRPVVRRLPVGAEPLAGGGVHFRVWAPARHRVGVVLEIPGTAPRVFQLGPESDGYFSGIVADAGAGTLYRYALDGDERPYPDPASRYQPEGPHGPSQVIDPSLFRWTDPGWRGLKLDGQVIYELHVGAFTPEGTLEAARAQLPELAALGVTVVELMPLSDFPGRFGWGYDGVDLFAPTRLYGEPDDLRRFVDSAHSIGMGVIVDVVYNHFGPDGNYLRAFSPYYFTDRYENEWGDAINFDGEHSAPVRELVAANAGYWVDEFHMDGLRLDATQQIFDSSEEHILTTIARSARAAAGDRHVLLVAENEPEQVRLVKPVDEGGYGLDALWNDDFHHSARVAMTGHNEAYYSDYSGTPQELISAMKRGYLSQGQHYQWQGRPRGSSTRGIRPATFITFLQNHDQVANSAFGQRCDRLTSPGLYRAFTALTLLSPGTPLLFMGQEFAASSPFLFFADHNRELAPLVAAGRKQFLSQFPSIATPEVQSMLPDPSDPKTFVKCKLDLSERKSHAWAYALHRDLLRLRREDPVLRGQGAGGIDGAVLSDAAFLIRLFGAAEDDRLLLVNLGRDLKLPAVQEPLIAPPAGTRWSALWCSEDPRYGGLGSPSIETREGWRVHGQSLVLLGPTPIQSRRRN